MKRHNSLIPLSRFHRSCLFFALIAKANAPEVKGYPTEISGKIDFGNTFYEGPLNKHFSSEDKLWKYISGKSTRLKDIIEDLKSERQTIHKLFQELKKTRSEKTLNELGDLFEKHVRKEERVLFQQIQSDLTEEELSEIVTILG